MLNASAYYPKWMQKRDEDQAQQFVQISYVSIPYYEFPDSTFKVTDEEINKYVQRNKVMFKQKKER